MDKETYEKWVKESFLKTLEEGYNMSEEKVAAIKEVLMLKELDKEKTMTPEENFTSKRKKNGH